MKRHYTLLLVALVTIGASAQPCDAVVQVSPAHDTICDGDMTSITLLGPAVPVDTLRFRYNVEIPPGITVTSGPQMGLPLGYEISDQIFNITNAAQLVLFIVTPYLINHDDRENCVGIPDTALVWVEPTAKVTMAPITDTVNNGDNVSITLTSPSVPTREVRFRYTHEAPPGVTVTPGVDNNLPPNYTITDQIVNTTNTDQLVSFIVTPYSRNVGDAGENCTGENDTAFIWVKPESEYLTVTVDNIIEDPCEGGNRGAIEITVSGGTSPYSFNWEGPFGLVRDTEDIYNIPGGNWNLTVTDTLGAKAVHSIFVPIASGMLTSYELSHYGEYNISEYGKLDGWIWVEYVLNGNGYPEDYTFEYEYNDLDTNLGFQDTLSGLGAGEFTLVITDTVGCTDTILLILLQPDDETTMINPVTETDIKVTNYGDYILTSETFDICRVFNMTGSVVKQVNDDTNIPVSDLSGGIYLFYLKFGSAEIVQRFYIE